MKPGLRNCFFANIRKYKFLYILMIPGILYFIIFAYLPMYGIVVAFQNFIPSKGLFHSQWVGLMHFDSLVSSVLFKRVLFNTLLLSAYKLLWGFPIPIILAIALNEVRCSAYKKIVQTVSYLPNFVSWVIITGMVYTIFNDNYGVLANIFNSLGLEYKNISRNPDHFRAFLVMTSIWKTAGWNSVIYLAAITNIDPTLYESAKIDGANKWKMIAKITIPCIAPIIAIIMIFCVGAILTQDYEQIFMLAGENPSLNVVSDVFESYVVREGIRNNSFSFPAAVGLFQSFFGMWLIFGVNKLAKKLGYAGIW